MKLSSIIILLILLDYSNIVEAKKFAQCFRNSIVCDKCSEFMWCGDKHINVCLSDAKPLN